MDNKIIHIPVLLKEVISSLKLNKSDTVFDGTLGGGGYSMEICKKIEKGILLATDLDQDAIDRAKKRLIKFKNKKIYFRKNYSKIKEILQEANLKQVDKIVLDLGISSDQLENLGRGISFKSQDDDLDMNLSSVDIDKKLNAKEILNTWSEESLADIFFYYGGEKAAKKVAKAIVKKREEGEFEKVFDLTELIENEIGHFYKNKKIDPSTKIFQALRITVNDEILNLEKVLQDGIEVLKNGGIFSVVTFHSLEDKKVKKIFRNMENIGIGKRVNKKVIKPSFDEVLKNRRARSAKLRIFEKK